MPVYEQGYAAYDGPRQALSRRWWPLFREEVVPFFKKRRFLFLLLLALVPWFYGVALTLLHTQLGDAESVREFVGKLPSVDEKLIAELLGNGWDLFLLLIVCIWVGSGLVARDRRDMTLPVFLGRGVGSMQYLWAKAAALGVFLLLFSLVPLAVLVIFQVGLTGEPGWLLAHARVLWGSALYTVLGLGTLALFVLALSSLGRSPRLVGVAFIAVVFLGDAACFIAYGITKSEAVWFFSLAKELASLAHRCLGVAPQGGGAVPFALTVVFFVCLAGASAAVLALRFGRRGVLR